MKEEMSRKDWEEEKRWNRMCSSDDQLGCNRD
jgi:hypothetical protein